MSYIGEDVLRKLYTEDKMARKVKNCVWRYAE